MGRAVVLSLDPPRQGDSARFLSRMGGGDGFANVSGCRASDKQRAQEQVERHGGIAAFHRTEILADHEALPLVFVLVAEP